MLHSAIADWELAFLVLYAEDTFSREPKNTMPAPDPRLGKWQVDGIITGLDAVKGPDKLLALNAGRVFYGWVLQANSGEYVVVIRGTEAFVEWLIDAEVAPMSAHDIAGEVETGFWSVYETLKVGPTKLADYLRGVGEVTIAGHSLGGAIATYLTFDMADRLGGENVRGCYFASPHPGDDEFSIAFGKAVAEHVMYRNVNDVVPSTPFLLGYTSVPNVEELNGALSGVEITGGLAAQHHLVSYAALINRDSLAHLTPLAEDASSVAAVRFVPPPVK